uniref:Protein MCM10 homolog n=1 Tax=Scleropages formosus TaxID=113540 RepID=A0A8C9QYE8_SCLFO
MKDQGSELVQTLDQKASDNRGKFKADLEAELQFMQEHMQKLQQQLEASYYAKAAAQLPQDQSSMQEAPRHERATHSPTPPLRRNDPGKAQDSSPAFSSRLSNMDPLRKGQRVSHQPRVQTESKGQAQQSVCSKLSQSTGKASALQHSLPSTSTVEVALTTLKQATPYQHSLQDVAVEKFSGLRIRKPLVSSIEMERKMENRRLIRLSQLPERLAREKLEESDWVTFAVVVSKITPQSNSSGKTFSIWKLNDLRDLDVYISLFLFGEVHKEHWKTDPGTLIGLLNPNPMKPKEGSNTVCLSVDHPQKILVMGMAQDFGTCKATTKNGNPCSQLVNLYECQVCQYHMKAQYKRMSSKRMDLQSSFSGKVPRKARGKAAIGLKERLCHSGFHYGGVSSVACSASLSIPLKKNPTQTSLRNLVVRGSEQIVSKAKQLAMNSNDISGCSDDFKNLLSLPTPGALNLKRHLIQSNSSGLPGLTGTGIQSISAAQLIKQQKHQLLESRHRRAEEAQHRFLQTVPVTQMPKGVNLTPKQQHLTPKLGRGFSESEDILFFDHVSSPAAVSLSAAKLAALKKLQAKGAVISKEDPNAVKRKRPSISDIAGRVEKNLASHQCDSEVDLGEPELKRRREYLEYLQSDDFQQILNAKSKHLESLQAAEVQIQKEYFDPLVQKEQLEEKMRNIQEMKCRAVTCKTCKYTYFKPLDRCVQEKHEYSWHNAVKRFFKCPCGQRSIALDKLPHKHCSNCGLFKWERDGMIKEKSGPKIGGELLLPRGEEHPKFLMSMK